MADDVIDLLDSSSDEETAPPPAAKSGQHPAGLARKRHDAAAAAAAAGYTSEDSAPSSDDSILGKSSGLPSHPPASRRGNYFKEVRRRALGDGGDPPGKRRRTTNDGGSPRSAPRRRREVECIEIDSASESDVPPADRAAARPVAKPTGGRPAGAARNPYAKRAPDPSPPPPGDRKRSRSDADGDESDATLPYKSEARGRDGVEGVGGRGRPPAGLPPVPEAAAPAGRSPRLGRGSWRGGKVDLDDEGSDSGDDSGDDSSTTMELESEKPAARPAAALSRSAAGEVKPKGNADLEECHGSSDDSSLDLEPKKPAAKPNANGLKCRTGSGKKPTESVVLEGCYESGDDSSLDLEPKKPAAKPNANGLKCRTGSSKKPKENVDLSDCNESGDDSSLDLEPRKPAAMSAKASEGSKRKAGSSNQKEIVDLEDSDGSDDDSSLDLELDIPAVKPKDGPNRGERKKPVKSRVSFGKSTSISVKKRLGPPDSCDDDSDDMSDPGPRKMSAGKPPGGGTARSQAVINIDDSSCDGDSSTDELLHKTPMFKAARKRPAPLKSSEDGDDLAFGAGWSDDMMTPRAPSPSSSALAPPSSNKKRRQVPTPAIPAMTPALVKEIGGKLYPDLTHQFIVALTSHARNLRCNAYSKGAFDGAVRSVVALGLFLRPLRSPEAAKRLKGVGGQYYEVLTKSVKGAGKNKKAFQPAVNKFSSVAAAGLVALLELEAADPPSLGSFSMESLLGKINDLLDPRCNANLNQRVEYYLDANNIDPGWLQIKKLISSNASIDLDLPFIKERKRKDACPSGRMYELTDTGRAMAKRLKLYARTLVESGPLRQLPDTTVDEEFGMVTMSMDFREGGGGGKSLHRYCDELDSRGVPYVVRELKVADYIFFIGDKLAPILIERKTAEDVASSLHDGRWERQQRNMRKAQFVLGGGPARRCQICYIIEGDPSKRTVHGGNVGRRNWSQSVDDVENAIGTLPSLGFSVMRSKGHLHTVTILARIVSDVSWRANNRSIDAHFNYAQFMTRVKHVSEEMGDPPSDPQHQNPAPPIVVENRRTAASSSHASASAAASSGVAAASRDKSDADDDDDIEMEGSAKNSTFDEGAARAQLEHNEAAAELRKLSIAALKERCKERDEKISGKKDDLIARLLKPRKPEILILRARRKLYVPRVPSSNAAIMVALVLHHTPGSQGITKERLMVLAEETGVSKESMSGDGGSFYDGWSGVKQLLDGDPALVRKEKGFRYSLTTQPPNMCGIAVAKALHKLAHQEGLCSTPPAD